MQHIFTGDYMDEALKRYYESVLILSLINPVTNNTEFQMNIKHRAETDYGYKFRQDEPVCTNNLCIILYLPLCFLALLAEGHHPSFHVRQHYNHLTCLNDEV